MKPIKLSMTAFGPYHKETVVDFKQYSKQGLFLICGDTGAGKTTIFDGITYALYDETSGSNRKIPMLRSDYADYDTPTRVALTFSHKGKIYEVERMLAFSKGEKRTQKIDATLHLDETTVITGKTNVTKAIEDLLGVDYQQFKQLSMIAQGEFLDLLLAKSDERGEIFRKIFDTKRYKQLEDILRNKANTLKDEHKRMKERELQYLEDIIVPEDSAYYENLKPLLDQVSIYETEEIIEYLEKLIEETKIIDKDNEKKEKNLEKELLELREKNLAIESAKANAKKLAAAKKQLEELELKKPLMEHRKQEVHGLEQLRINILPYNQEYAAALEEKSTFDEERQKNQARLSQLSEVYEQWKLKLETYKEHKPKADAVQKEIDHLEEMLPKYQHAEELKTVVERKSLALKEISLQLLKLKEQEENSIKNIEALTKKLESLKDNKRDVAIKEHEKEKSIGLWQKYAQIVKKGQELLELNGQKELYQKEVKKSLVTWNEAVESFQTYRLHFFAGQAGILASSLHEGDPCPVCGSLSHPHKAPQALEGLKEETLKELEEQKDKRYENLELKKEKLAKLDSQIEALLASLTEDIEMKDHIDGNKIISIYQEKYQNEQKQLKEIEASLQTLNKFIKQEPEILTALNNEELGKVKLEENKVLLEHSKEDEQQSYLKLQAEYAATKEQLTFDDAAMVKELISKKKESILKFTETLATYQEGFDTSYIHLLDAKSSEKHYQERSPKIKQRLEETKDRLLEKMKEEGLSTYEELKNRASLLTNLEIWKKEVNDFEKVVQESKIIYRNIEKDSVNCDILREELVKNRIASVNVYLEQLRTARKSMYSMLDQNSKILKQVKDLMKRRQKTIEYQLALIQLSDTANGTLSQTAKITFERYVQSAYFSMIVAEANKRLETMSDGRFELLIRQESNNRINQVGLDLDVYDYNTGKSRTVQSLSGGESFQAALSLALGLSDVIQSLAGGIQIDTMFIDEGFGALDAESLEQAIAILQTLTKGNRLVGIISHVSELRERIDGQIVVRKGIEGSYIE